MPPTIAPVAPSLLRLLWPMTAPLIMPRAPPMTAPCSVLGPLPAQPLSSDASARPETQTRDLFMVEAEMSRSEAAFYSTPVMETTAVEPAAVTVAEPEAQRNRRVPD